VQEQVAKDGSSQWPFYRIDEVLFFGHLSSDSVMSTILGIEMWVLDSLVLTKVFSSLVHQALAQIPPLRVRTAILHQDVVCWMDHS